MDYYQSTKQNAFHTSDIIIFHEAIFSSARAITVSRTVHECTKLYTTYSSLKEELRRSK